MRTPGSVVLALTLLAALLHGPGATATATTATGAQGAGQLRGVITFDKNGEHPQRSRLTWRVYRHHDGTRTLVERKAWRAGSGFTRRSTDACRKNDGWLPDGHYRPRLHADYWGSLIKGRAIGLGAKQCADGTWRTDLFIHTEQGEANRQCPDRKGDQVCRWEYPRIDDYRSWGCIKMSPGDLRELVTAWRAHFDLGADSRVRVLVRR